MAPLLLNDSEDNKTDVETNGLSSKTDKSSGFIIEKSKESKENQLPLHQIIKLINPDNLVSIRKAAKANENPFIHIFKRGGFKKKKKTFRFANRDLKGKIIRVKGLIGVWSGRNRQKRTWQSGEFSYSDLQKRNFTEFVSLKKILFFLWVVILFILNRILKIKKTLKTIFLLLFFFILLIKN